MIDTIKFTKHINKAERDHLEKIFALKTHTGAFIFYPNENRAIASRYKNLKLSLGESSLTITGSLTKLYYGNNFQQLNYHQLIDLLRSLEDLLATSLDEAIISRVDIACNINLNSKVSSYLTLLSPPKGYKLHHYENETKYFTSGVNIYCIYDKIKEAKANNDFYKEDSNVLRYELRFNKNIAKQLSWKDSKLSNLYDYNDYVKMIKSYWQAFCQIPFSRNYNDMPYDFTSIKAVKQKLIIDGVKYNGGSEGLLSSIKSSQVKRETRYWIRKMIDSLPKGGVSNLDLINELGTKILTTCQQEIYTAIHHSFDAPFNTDDAAYCELPDDDDVRN